MTTRRSLRTMPQVEALENRCLLTSYYSYAVNGSLYHYQLDGMPDLDQKRAASGSIAGLPGNGAMYCVPTAAVNALAFLANHGCPELMSGLGEQDWQSPSVYNAVTEKLACMGFLMGTDPVAGTTGGATKGLQAWLNGFAPGKFAAHGYGPTTVDAMASMAGGGALVIPVIGWYTTSDGIYFTRAGGHAFNLVDAKGTQGAFQPKSIGIRDPNRTPDANLTTQSNFTTNTYTVTTTLGSFDGVIRMMDKVNGIGNNAYLDGCIVIAPTGASLTYYDTYFAHNFHFELGGGGSPEGGEGRAGSAEVVDLGSALLVPPSGEAAAPTVSLPASLQARPNTETDLPDHALPAPKFIATAGSHAGPRAAAKEAIDRLFAGFEVELTL